MPIKKGYVETAEGQVHYRYSLAVGDNTPLVMLHKVASSSKSFETLMA